MKPSEVLPPWLLLFQQKKCLPVAIWPFIWSGPLSGLQYTGRFQCSTFNCCCHHRFLICALNWVLLLGCDWDLSHLPLWTRIFQVPLHRIRLRQMHDGQNVTNGFKPALRADGLHHSLDTLDLDLDLLLLLFNIEIFLLIWLSNWQPFLPFSLFVVAVVMVMAIQHLHMFLNIKIFLLTSSDNCLYFQHLLLLLQVSYYNQELLWYVFLFIKVVEKSSHYIYLACTCGCSFHSTKSTSTSTTPPTCSAHGILHCTSAFQ